LAAFATAYDAARVVTPRARDMLWQLATPRMGALSDMRLVALLGRDPRGPDASVDLATLRPTALRVLGREGWSRIVGDAERAATDATVRARIGALR
jgi:hypothetical protein